MIRAQSLSIAPAPKPVLGTLIAGGLLIGTVDLLFAWGFWASYGATLRGILQSIAEGWYGKASHQMGAISAVVGALSHYFISVMFVVAYWLASRRAEMLIAHPYRSGIVYGLLLYLVMNLVVLPLSAAGLPSFSNLAWVGASIVAHAVFGVLCAIFARRARPDVQQH